MWNRMKIRAGAALAVLWLATVVAGCFTLSVHPFYAPADLVQDDALLGVWGEEDEPDAETWQFLSEDGGYRLIIREGNTLRIDPEADGVFIAHLFRLGDATYLDFFPAEPERASDFFKSHIVPAHSVWRVEWSEGRLGLSILDIDAVRESGAELDQVKRDGVTVLTASTSELREVLRTHGPTLFGETEYLHRIQ